MSRVRRSREQEAVQVRREERKGTVPAGRRRRVQEEVGGRAAGPGGLVTQGHYNSDYPWHCPTRGFLWPQYLEGAGARAAPARLFPDPLQGHGFTTGMKLEAVDPEHQGLVCVVSVVEVVGHRLRLHFDGYGDSHDFWEAADSENLFPAEWSLEHGQVLAPPKGYSPTNFLWSSYLSLTQSRPAPEEIFLGRARAAREGEGATQGWRVGCKLEALDMQDSDQELVYVATVANVLEGRVLVHFDGWSINHDYWTRPGGPYVHPVGWSSSVKRKLIPPQDSQDTPTSFCWPDYLAASGTRPVPSWAFRSVPHILPFLVLYWGGVISNQTKKAILKGWCA